MPDNGSGVYTAPAGTKGTASTTIESAKYNTFVDDAAAAFTNRVCRDGQSTMTGNLKMGGKKVVNVAPGTAATDAVNKEQVYVLVDTLESVIAATLSGTTYSCVTTREDAPANGYMLTIEPDTDNPAGGCSLNPDTLGAVAIKLNDGTNPPAGAMRSGGKYDLQHDGTVFLLKNPTVPIPSATETVDVTNRSTTSTSYTSSSVSVSITPKLATSKVEIEVDGRLGGSGVLLASFTLYRDATDLTPSGVNGFDQTRCNGSDQLSKMGFSFLDSPNTTSSITYTLYWKTNTGTAHLGRRGDDTALDVPTIIRAKEILV